MCIALESIAPSLRIEEPTSRPTIQRILHDNWQAFAANSPQPKFAHRAAFLLTHCRTPLLGGHVERCEHGHVEKVHYNSCRHRLCPGCSAAPRKTWLDKWGPPTGAWHFAKRPLGVDSRAAGRRVQDLALPEGAVIALISRGDQIVPPQGSTYIQPRDHIILVLRPGIQPLVNQVFGSCFEVRGIIPNTLEFPLRGSTTVGEIRELYAIQIDTQPGHSLAEAISNHLGNHRPAVDNAIRFGQVNFRVLRLSSEGQIEMVGMSLLPMDIYVKTLKSNTS